jgi:peroxygenase
VSGTGSGARTALQKHVDFFDTNHDGKITLLETYRGCRRLGYDALRSFAFASVINAALGTSTSGFPSLTVDTGRIHAGKHRSDTGVYDKRGRFSAARFKRLFERHDLDRDGALSRGELSRLLTRNRTDLMGHLGSKAEFTLLFDLAGEMKAGRRLLTRERLLDFYNGSLFYRLADEIEGRAKGTPKRRSKASSHKAREAHP